MHTFIFSFAAVTLCRIGRSSAELSQITGFLPSDCQKNSNCAHASHQLDKKGGGHLHSVFTTWSLLAIVGPNRIVILKLLQYHKYSILFYSKG